MSALVLLAAVYILGALLLVLLFIVHLIEFFRLERKQRSRDRELVQRVRRDHLGAKG